MSTYSNFAHGVGVDSRHTLDVSQMINIDFLVVTGFDGVSIKPEIR